MSRAAVDSGYAQALRPGVPRREIARAGRRPLDPPARARHAARRAAVPGLPGEPAGDPTQHPLGPAQADGEARAGDAAVLLRAPAARGVLADRQGARARRGRWRPGRVGLAARPPADGAGARRVRPSGRGQVCLPAVRRPGPRRHRRASAPARVRDAEEAGLGSPPIVHARRTRSGSAVSTAWASRITAATTSPAPGTSRTSPQLWPAIIG